MNLDASKIFERVIIVIIIIAVSVAAAYLRGLGSAPLI
jgi:hypothetical protein